MSFKNTLVGAGLIFIVIALVTCGGGKGGGGSDSTFDVSGTGFGYTGISGNLSGSGTSGQYPILDGINIPIQIQFTEELNPATVSSQSIDIRTIDVPASQDPLDLVQTSGGIQANVEFQVYGSTLVIYPVLSFNEGDPVFGFKAHAAYEIKFLTPPSPQVVASKSGKLINVPTGQPFVFITTAKVYDRFDGTPDPMFYYYDSTKGPENLPSSWVFLEEGSIQDIPVQPLPKFRVFFDEPVLKLWSENMFLVNSSDHTSDTMQIQYYPSPHQIVPIPGLWYIVQTTDIRAETEGLTWKKEWLWENPQQDPLKVGMSYVLFTPNPFLQALPPDLDIEIIAKGLIADLATNVKGEDVKDTRKLHSKGDAVLKDIVEGFSSKSFEDEATSSAIWGEDYKGKKVLTWGGGGGTGIHGQFFPPDFFPTPNFPDMDPQYGTYDENKPLIPEVTMDAANKLIELPTCSYIQYTNPDYKVWSHFEYNFTSFIIPFGWSVKIKDLDIQEGDTLPDRMDLTIFVTGKASIQGSIDASGGDGVSRIVNSYDYPEPGVAEININGTDGGISFAGGAPGGKGGSIPSEDAPNSLKLNIDPDLDPAKSPGKGEFDIPETEPTLHFKGVTGINEGVYDYYIVENNTEVMTALINLGEALKDQMIQPNVGMGLKGAKVVTNRPTFYIKEIVTYPGDHVEIYTFAEGEEKYRGKFTDPSNDPKDIFGQHPPIAKLGDTYIIGYLQGSDGQSSSVFDCGGKGGDPLTVAQGAATYASAGGGGGGGGVEAGLTGETGYSGAGYPPFGGNSSPETIGGPASATNFLHGTVQNVNNAEDKIQVVVNNIEALTTSDLEALTNYRINPNTNPTTEAATGDWFFNIRTAAWVLQPGDSLIEFQVDRVKRADENPDFEYSLEHVAVGAAFGTEVIVVPPAFVGGSGGGGSGVELTDTLKVYDLNPTNPPYASLPIWKHGAGGGSGGGTVCIESAKTIEVSAAGKILAKGGNGGVLSGFLGNIPSGGGGSGGSIVLRARDNIQVQFGGQISCEGGLTKLSGGSDGKGGAGFLRFETSQNNLLTENYSNGRAIPAVTNKDLGKFISANVESLGMSDFYPAGIIFVKYTGLQIKYSLDILDLASPEGYVQKDGLVFPEPDSGQEYNYPPIEVYLNSADAIPETGFLDTTTITDDFVDWDTFMNDESLHKPYLRFKILIRDRDPEFALYDPDHPTGGDYAQYVNPRILEFSVSFEQK